MSIKRKLQVGEERANAKHRKTSPERANESVNAPSHDKESSDGPAMNDNIAPQSLSKAEKKALRKQRKEAELNGTESSKETKEEKRRRKAEKKAAKALNTNTESDGEHTPGGVVSEATNGQETQVPNKAARKLEKQRLKEARNEDRAHKERTSNPAQTEVSTKSFLEAHSITFTDTSLNTQCNVIDSFSKLPSKAAEIIKPFQRFEKPTPIQATSWHPMLEKRDVVGVAETGSGKTLAFGVPLIDHVLRKRASKGAPSALVVSPTRELAVQIQEQIAVLAKPYNLHSVCIYGGVPKDPQREELRRASIIIATPGRLNDFLDEGAARLSSITYVVLDEADRMLDKGFEDAIRKIITATSQADRQTLMFTATWPPSVRDLAATFMHNPVRITIGTDADGSLRANTRIKQLVEVVDPYNKETRLLELLREHQSGKNKDARILVFCLYKKEATRIENLLRRKGLRVAGIHGDLSQERRSASLDSFKTGHTPLLVATDVAARGLDIPDVRLVLNVTFPLTVEDYVHRIGRTGRAGADGLAITLFTDHDKALAGALVNVLKAAGQPVPDSLLKFGTAVKKKAHDSYGAFYRAPDEGAKKATKITFDD